MIENQKTLTIKLVFRVSGSGSRVSKSLVTHIAFAIALICAIGTPASAGDMDLLMRQMLRATSISKTIDRTGSPGLGSRVSGLAWSKASIDVGGRTLVPCLIKTRDATATSLAVKSAGGYIQMSSGDILAAYIPLDLGREIASRKEIEFIEAALPLHQKMDTARTASAVDTVQSGAALGTAYNGKNVVVGTVDDGLDYNHPDFLDSDSHSRVQYVMQKSGDDLLECTKRTIADASCQITDGGQGYTHGTHVTGIATGGDSVYTGVAPSADIMFVFNSSDDPDTSGTGSSSFATTVLEGVSKIFEKADLMDKAAVVNLSLGTSVGAHDGTSLLEEGLTQMANAKPGRIIVGAMGNEQAVPQEFDSGIRDYVGGIHASVDVSAGSSKAHRLAIWSGTGAASVESGGTLVDLWLTPGQKDSCSVAVFAYSNGRSSEDFTFPGLSSTGDSALATGDVPFASDTTAPVTATGLGVTASVEVDDSDARNEKPHATILFSPTSGSGSTLERGWFDVVIRASAGGECSGHMWLYYDYTLYHDFLKGIAGGTYDVATGANGVGYQLADGDSLYTTTIPATARGVIAAGSWMPAKPIGSGSSKWTGDNGVTYDQSDISAPGGTGSVTDDLSGFSSLGPTADGRTKPDIVAPGEPIISTKARNATASSAIKVGDNHIKEAGTSMSSPHIAGIVALLLQRNNTLGVDAVRTALSAGADTSAMTVKTPDPANSYGPGKVNAATVLASVGEDTSAYSGTGDLDPIPSSGGGCSLVLPNGR